MGTLNRGGQKEGAAVSLTILNSISSLVAENSLNQTAAGQQKALEQLSTGLKINSSADDAAGLAIAMGLQANTTALAQSYVNANNGVSFLQVADGALSQVTSLLDRAVTLATESASSGLTSQQRGAANTEYQSILNEIDQIGSATQFNGTQVFTDGNNSPVQLANGGSTVTGTINPADTLSGGFDVASTIPGTGNPPSDIQLTDSGGTSTSGNITPGNTLSGSITINSKTSEIDGVGEELSFTASSDGSTLTSDPITAGDTLSGSLVVDSAGGNASGSETINLANYQGLASSDSTTATAAANQLAADMTAALGATTGSTYTASISGGVLNIQTSNPVNSNPAPVSVSFDTGNWELWSSTGLYAGSTLTGSLNFTSSGGNAAGSATIDFANYQGLTSADPTTQSAALTQLGNDLTATLGATTGSTYSLGINESGNFWIESSNAYERFQIGVSDVTETPVYGTQNVPLMSNGGSQQLYTNSIAPGSVASGILNLSVTGPDGTATASINLADGYSDIFGSDSNAWNEQMNLQNVLSTDFASSGADVQVMGGEGSLWFNVMGGPDSSISDNGSTIQATLSGGETLSVDGSSSGFQAAIIPATSTPNTISLTGQTTAGLQSYLQTQLGSDYTVTYDNTSDSNSGDLTIALNSVNSDGYTSFTSSSSAQQTDGTPPVISSTSVSLAGLTKTNLASSLLTQLGGDYTVSYDQNSGALSIGISTAGSEAGITSIASSANNAVETAPTGTTGLSAMVIFTSDGTTNGGTNLDVTVGSLTTANLGTANGSAGVDLSATNLNSAAKAASALGLITSAVNGIASQRGAVGANINRLSATASDIGTEQINLTSASNSIMNADIGKAVANMTQYNILQSTGMASLQQANQAQQAVLKLLQ